MKRLFRSILVLLMVGTMTLASFSRVEAGGSDSISLPASITGLAPGEEATLDLITEPAPSGKTPILSKSVLSNGEAVILVDISSPLQDGYYQLILRAPDKYFRRPKGYFFMVSKSVLVNPLGHSIVFEIVPPEKQQLRTFREADIPAVFQEPDYSASATSVMEPMISLSAPAKAPITGDAVDHSADNHHWFDYWSWLSVPGIAARFAVTDPGVAHDGTYNEFAVDHIYAASSYPGSSHIEIGWAELSWQSDTRYVFDYDSVLNFWYLYSNISNPLYVRLVASGTFWSPEQWTGSSWSQLNSATNLNMSLAGNQYNGGEIFSNYGNHISYPSTTTDVAKLLISGSWTDWNWQRWATTSTRLEPSGSTDYGITTYTSYYYFSIYKN